MDEKYNFTLVREGSNFVVWTKYPDDSHRGELLGSLQADYQNNFKLSLSRNIYIVYIYIDQPDIKYDTASQIADGKPTSEPGSDAKIENLCARQRLDDIMRAEKVLREKNGYIGSG